MGTLTSHFIVALSNSCGLGLSSRNAGVGLADTCMGGGEKSDAVVIVLLTGVLHSSLGVVTSHFSLRVTVPSTSSTLPTRVVVIHFVSANEVLKPTAFGPRT